ncbi:MAG: hypothetical protein MZV64_28685 [Ignavibacteriales bacterium]|nr:hypothetical protein [Ignavibacteriales bacterium]
MRPSSPSWTEKRRVRSDFPCPHRPLRGSASLGGPGAAGAVRGQPEGRAGLLRHTGLPDSRPATATNPGSPRERGAAEIVLLDILSLRGGVRSGVFLRRPGSGPVGLPPEPRDVRQLSSSSGPGLRPAYNLMIRCCRFRL